MSKFIAEKTFRMTNENNDLVISYVVHGLEKDAALLAYEETRNSEKKLEVEVKPYRSKRSLEQNKLLWVLLGKLATAMSGKKNKVSSEEAYAVMLEEANVSYDYLLALPEAEPMLKKSFRVVRKMGERKVNGKTLNVYQYFIGSSKFDTQEMTELIEATLCYIADSRFKYTSEDDIDGSYNYEWWYWTNIPVRVWAIVDNELCFGTRDGQVCVFDNEYTDRTHQTSQPGDLSLDLLNNRITYNSHIRVDLAENDIITFSTSGIYALALRDFTVKDNKIYVTEEEIVNLTEGTEVYADNVEESGLSINTKYLFHEIDKGACCFGLIDDEGNEVEINGEGFRLCKYISQKTLYLSNITESTFQLKEYKSGEVLTLTNYNGSLPTSITAKVTHRENVVAEWYTPIFDLGTNESSKTLLKMTISTNPEINGKLSFGYETRSVNKLINAKGINVFSFDNFSFENFSFETGFANSYSVKCKERNFNFIIFRFVSDNDSDCIVNTFTVLYKINKSNKGVE